VTSTAATAAFAASNRARRASDSGLAACVAEANSSTLDELALGADGFTAAHTTSLFYNNATVPPSADHTEQIVASDSTGVHVLDSVASENPAGQPVASSLTGLQLTGDTLTWDHAGASESAVLH
jgi:hypothetical protein